MKRILAPGAQYLSHGDERYLPNEAGVFSVSDEAAAAFTRAPHNLELLPDETFQLPLFAALEADVTTTQVAPDAPINEEDQ
jgi:hypothetical protein